MPEITDLNNDMQTSAILDEQTSAPGDLPLPAIQARLKLQRGQFRHDNILVPVIPVPGQSIEIWATTGMDATLACATLFYTTDGRQPDTSAMTVAMERVHTDWDVQAGYLARWRAIIPGQPAHTLVRYRIGGWSSSMPDARSQTPDVWAQDGQGFWFRYTGDHAITTFGFTVDEPAPLFPTWAQEAVVYQIFLDRYRTSAPGGFTRDASQRAFHGGTLQGVREALPYLSELGVTCLWLSPIHPADTYDRYGATDFYAIDPRLGTSDDLKALTEQAHALGMRVLLDFVPSHLSMNHAAFRAAQQDQNAPSFDWFTFYEWPHRYRNFLEVVPALASFNTASQAARDYIINAALLWMHDYGIDGFRLDHAIGQSMDFWAAFRKATREVAPDVISIGEVTDTPDSIARYAGKLDGILDFPLATALRHTFALGDWTVQTFEHFLQAYEQFLSHGPGRVSFLDNHDMNRFLFLARNDRSRLKMAALCQFTLEAIPVVYYGTEIGMSQAADIDNMTDGGDAQARADMIWDQERWDHDLLAFYRALIWARSDYPVLRQGKRQMVHLDAARNTYAYVRTHTTGPEWMKGDVFAIFNVSKQQQGIPLAGASTSMSYLPLITSGEQPQVQVTADGIQVVLGAMSGALLVAQ
ncbi:alpha-amylase [Dictyobacter alpinus]|uniref:Alpha-amylase n=1 Tax=Dictyobacter alpinus TaxID=2014873 RepID=A0A402BE91_9CHLR|nr:alpha-amylase family glycosyl hydrolase [Dictyobacter alpinus]GCE29703.1 alpha-amylase [Dictyobacter alpinus]